MAYVSEGPICVTVAFYGLADEDELLLFIAAGTIFDLSLATLFGLAGKYAA